MTLKKSAALKKARQAVITVGEGRGFVVSSPRDPYREQYVVTAAHCLPKLPPADPWSYTLERTYAKLLGPLGEPPHVWAECAFVDPVGDVAVLMAPDYEPLPEQYEAWCEFIERRCFALPAAAPPRAESFQGYMLSLENQWIPCDVEKQKYVRRFTVADSSGGIKGGMSGSPIIDQVGNAVGVLSTGIITDKVASETHGQPCLVEHLPAWLIPYLGLPMPRPRLRGGGPRLI